MRKVGYARVSTRAQNLDRQIGALRAERCHENLPREGIRQGRARATAAREGNRRTRDRRCAGVAEWDRARGP